VLYGDFEYFLLEEYYEESWVRSAKPKGTR